MNTPDKSIDQKILDNFYKQSADKIIQNLEKVREERKKNARRWIWELLQNAKDVKNIYRKVSIQISYGEDRLSFSHNGDPFSEDDLISLVQQVSSKDSENEDDEVTGKFGTGFISTHLLSDLILVNGVLHRDSGKFQCFQIQLDRQASKSEALAVLIKRTIETIRKLDEDPAFQPADGYSEGRTEELYDTSFLYELKDDPSRNTATSGLQELVENLPLALVFLDKIKTVTVTDEKTGTTDQYTCTIDRSIDKKTFYTVTKRSTGQIDQALRFIKMSAEKNEIDLVIPVNDFQDLMIAIPDGRTPYLYRDFPLVGSERFYFPFYLNGRTFFTTVDRDGILLNGKDGKPGHNWDLLKIARTTAIQFTKFLIQEKAKNLFVLAQTRLPYIAELEEETESWFTDYQRQWRTDLIDLHLVETIEDNIPISALKMPVSDYGATANNQEQMYSFVSDVYGKQIIPRPDLLQDWSAVFYPSEEYDTWGIKPLWNETAILGEIHAAGSLANLEFKNETIVTEAQKLAWLNRFFSHMDTNKQLVQLDKIAVTPNQYGHFQPIEPLFWEPAGDPIADELLDVLQSLKEDWRKTMVKRGIQIAGLLKKERGLAAASKALTDILSVERKDKGVIVSDFLGNSHAQEILVDIMSLITDNVDKTSFRYKVFTASKELLQFPRTFREVKHLNGFSFEKATDLLTRYLNTSIEKCINLQGLATRLHQTDDQAVVWLNSYLALLDGSKGFRYLLDDGNIVLNRKGQLRAYEDLYNFGTDEQPLDSELLRILKELDAKQDWFPTLVGDGIALKAKKTLTIEELTKKIELLVNEIYSGSSMQPYRDQLLDLISWCDNAQHADLKRKHFATFEQKKDTIFYILTVKESAYNTQIMALMKKPEKIPVLMAIAESGIPPEQLQSLLNSIQGTDRVDKLVSYAQELKRKQDDFEFKGRLGKKMEDYFQEALQSANIKAEIKYIGSGSHDFVIKSQVTQKEFYIELKSHAKSNDKDPISLAISQARLAVSDPQRFALCVVERPAAPIEDIGSFMQEKVKYLGALDQDFSPVVNRAAVLDNIINDHSLILLELENPTYLVKVSREFIDSRARTFKELLLNIQQQLG
ncbi:MAG TPA: hypothetical protein VGN00_18820 [Puia sp.]|jgi:hypothetical protein